VRLIPAQFVKPYRKTNKNDFIDAEAIAEAVTKQNMRFVQIKSQEQLDIQAMHRVRDRLVQRRTALINEIRGFLLDRGLTFANSGSAPHLRSPMAVSCAAERRMLIHGARAVLFRVKYDSGGFGQWVHRLAQRAPRNKVVVAIANKLARIAWAVLSTGKTYRHQPLQPAAA